MDELFFDKNDGILTTQGDLPHWSQDGKLYFITFRLADSMPQSRLIELKSEKDIWLKNHPTPWDKETENEYHYRFSQYVDKWLDSNFGSCILRNPEVSSIVEKSLLFYNNQRYAIHAYVVMPNHIHILVEIYTGYEVQKIMHSWKSYTANTINKFLNRTGSVWWRESFDRIIRDKGHYINVKRYIMKNVQLAGVKWLI